ncbi:hypothetical protein G9A89_021466 [Geosiphon pyriformis]|nr:hypothetical protein G9A89_021466 [Geosiphon pyriformis]
MLLVLLNSCQYEESVSGSWREAWVLMIPKPYEWEDVLTNTCPIALIETAHKILSKILSDRIFSACSTHDVLYGDNFSVLKGTTTQSPIFAVGLVVEDALEKNRELWLVLQDMKKYLEKCLVKIKMCDKFIQFFGGIHRDFGLTDGYYVHDGLDQGEVFFPLLWRIFYDPLLCEVKHQKSVCGYRLIFHFVFKSGHVESQVGLSSYFAAGAFVDDTIWVGSSQSATQHILDIASEFFRINDILINNDKTIAILINCKVGNPTLFISGSPISVAKKGTFGHLFFYKFGLKKAISDKQFLYLVLAVLQPIISYRTQFSFVPIGICNKWDAIIHKGLKLKSGLPLDFPSNSIHYPSFYGLRSFLQIQSEGKIAFLINFANSGEIVDHLFSHRSHNLQVLCWCPIYPLSSPVCIRVSASNNFLAGLVHVLYNCKLSLDGSFPNSFRADSGMPMSTVLGESVFSRCLPSLRQYGVAFKKLDLHGPISEWFRLSAVFLAGEDSSSVRIPLLANIGLLNILGFSGFVSVCDHLSQVNARVLSVYTDGSLRNLGTVGCEAGAAVFFEDIGMGLGAIALALECVPVFSNVHLFLDSQSALDACKSELGLVVPDFHKRCWHKVKDHSGILGNEHADIIASAVSVSDWFLPPHLDEHFLMTDGNIVSGNSRHFVHDTFRAMCRARWEVGSGSKILPVNLCADVDWSRSSLVWHPDLHMATSFTNKILANTRSYFMKALHHQLPVAVQKRLYNRLYPSVLCLYCGNVEMSDHVFSCKVDDSARCRLLNSHMNTWRTLSGSSVSSSVLLQLLLSCVSGFSVSMALHKSFVFDEWFGEAVSVFHNPKVACLEVVNFAYSLGLTFRDEIWLVQAKHHAYMEKHGLIPLDGLSPTSVSGLTSQLSAGVVDLLGIDKAFGVHFGFCKSYMFFSGIGDLASVYIAV